MVEIGGCRSRRAAGPARLGISNSAWWKPMQAGAPLSTSEELQRATECIGKICLRTRWGAAQLDKACRLCSEAPCIDRVFDAHRLTDFYFEHASHFTTQSFAKAMQTAGEVENA
jgi:hypothetical protein